MLRGVKSCRLQSAADQQPAVLNKVLITPNQTISSTEKRVSSGRIRNCEIASILFSSVFRKDCGFFSKNFQKCDLSLSPGMGHYYVS